MSGSWSLFHHGADIGVEGVGATPSEAFANAGLALTAVVTDLSLVRSVESIDVLCEAPSLELLFLDWLNALIYQMATRRMLFTRFDVRIDGVKLHAQVRGETVDRERHHPAAEVKGATFTELNVSRDAQGRWCARCVVDV